MGSQPDVYSVTAKDNEIIITRSYHAPRELVYEAWTTPEHIQHWWGPNGFTITIYEMDVRPGGIWKYMMHGPDGTDYPNKIVYKTVIAPERLTYSHGTWEDEDASESFQVIVTFSEDEDEGGTELTMRMSFASAEIRELVAREYGAVEGAKQTLERLAQFLLEQKG
jgi:uncharacterized protein YndB with AHSA1/START domain